MCELYGIVRILRAKHIIIPWINGYLNDGLCLPIILPVILWGIKKWKIKKGEYSFTIYHILFAAGYISYIFEFYLPKHNSHFTADPWDIFCYFLGGIGYYSWQYFNSLSVEIESKRISRILTKVG
jgi:hypothetical protein